MKFFIALNENDCIVGCAAAPSKYSPSTGNYGNSTGGLLDNHGSTQKTSRGPHRADKICGRFEQYRQPRDLEGACYPFYGIDRAERMVVMLVVKRAVCRVSLLDLTPSNLALAQSTGPVIGLV